MFLTLTIIHIACDNYVFDPGSVLWAGHELDSPKLQQHMTWDREAQDSEGGPGGRLH